MGLLLGGTLEAEVVLALANVLWFVMLGVGSIVFVSDDVPNALRFVARMIPSGALAETLEQALETHLDVFGSRCWWCGPSSAGRWRCGCSGSPDSAHRARHDEPARRVRVDGARSVLRCGRLLPINDAA